MKKILFCLFVSSIFANEICAQITHQNTQDSARISKIRGIQLALGWNTYDKSMLGFQFQNRNSEKWHLNIATMYGFGSKNILGVANADFILNEATQLGLESKRFSFEPALIGRENILYTKFQPYLRWQYKSSAQKSFDRFMELNFNNQFFEENFNLLSKRKASLNPKYPKMGNRFFQVLKYKAANKNKNQAILIELEHAITFNKILQGRFDTINVDRNPTIVLDDEFTEISKRSSHLKLNLSCTKKFPLPYGNKKIKFRYFFSTFIQKPDDEFFNYWVGQNNGFFDYRFDEYLLGRGAENGFFYNQITKKGLQSKFIGRFFQSDDWISNLNTGVELPGILPVALYLEVLSSGNLKNQYFNSAKSPLIYNGGLCLDFKLAKIYVNLFQSKNITSSQQIQGINDLSEKMAFIFDLNKILRKPKVGFHPFNEQ